MKPNSTRTPFDAERGDLEELRFDRIINEILSGQTPPAQDATT